MGKIAAIDYGLKRIGIAISDAKKQMAFPLAVVEGGPRELEHLEKALGERKKEIELFVVGLPLLLNGKKGEMALKAEAFAKKLEKAFSLPVSLFDERLTSKQVEGMLKETGLNRKKRSERSDMFAAALLLQTFLDKNP